MNTAIIGTDIQIDKRIIKRKAWGSMRHQGIHRGSMIKKVWLPLIKIVNSKYMILQCSAFVFRIL
ncbi:hypothetical protein T12_1731 [Trichinella patagoniensis]|uniref:Uncharacterized protein n=1 Tax=Trichinella patagoniensis TaxID=990121 RepID=A0A0V0Z534_9BILA|nr:hypothetical protein T12_1731 [Trichinella patagoniensis]